MIYPGFSGFSGRSGHSGQQSTSQAVPGGPSASQPPQGTSGTAGFNNGYVMTGTITIGNISYSFSLEDVRQYEWVGEVHGLVRVE